MHITRHQLYRTLFAKLPLPLGGKILGISGLKYWKGSRHYRPDREIISKDAEIVETGWPKVSMCALPYPDNTFDYVISDQVLEHIEGDVQQAINEAYRVLKPGGLLIVGTGFIYPIHYGPKDLWRFSTDALRYLCRNFGTIIECGSWGNRPAHILFFLYDKARDWKVPKRRWSIMRALANYNDEKYPLSTWIIAKK